MAENKSKEIKNSKCPCVYVDCPRNGNCEKCQEYHRNSGSKTSCGK